MPLLHLDEYDNSPFHVRLTLNSSAGVEGSGREEKGRGEREKRELVG
jgi:hypothetical protein